MVELVQWILAFAGGYTYQALFGCIVLMVMLMTPFAKLIEGKRHTEAVVMPLVAPKMTIELYETCLAVLAKAAIYSGRRG